MKDVRDLNVAVGKMVIVYIYTVHGHNEESTHFLGKSKTGLVNLNDVIL